MLSVGFVCEFDPLSRKSWSGIHYTLFKMLQKSFEVEWINSDPLGLKYVFKAWMRLSIFAGKNFDWMHNLSYSRYLGRNISRRLATRKYDLLYAPAGSASLAFLETDIPIIYHSDATFRLAHNYYKEYSVLSADNASAGEILERRSLQKSTGAIFASSWAKQSAIIDYGISPDKVEVIPFVPNFDLIPPSSEIRYTKSSSLKLLFVGADWQRKGGSQVVEIYKALKKRYPDCRLRLVGRIPDEPFKDPNIEVLGFIDKNIPSELSRLFSIYLDSDFFILPTQAEAAGVVFAEASALGVPSLTYDTGGTAQYVENGVNGYIFPLGTGSDIFAEAIASAYDDPAKYQALRHSSRQKYELEFSQDRWLSAFENMLKKTGIA